MVQFNVGKLTSISFGLLVFQSYTCRFLVLLDERQRSNSRLKHALKVPFCHNHWHLQLFATMDVSDGWQQICNIIEKSAITDLLTFIVSELLVFVAT